MIYKLSYTNIVFVFILYQYKLRLSLFRIKKHFKKSFAYFVYKLWLENCIFETKSNQLEMKFFGTYLTIIAFLFLTACGSDSSSKAEKLGEGIYKKEGWIFDMKELPSGKNVIPFYTIGKLSSNVLTNAVTAPPSEMGITLYFSLDKKGENKQKIVSGFFESTATDESLFKFPRCLSICPLMIEIINSDGSIESSKMTYSRPNVFKMEMEDLVLADLAYNQRKIRIRIPVSKNNQNTIFEWFEFDFAGFSTEI